MATNPSDPYGYLVGTCWKVNDSGRRFRVQRIVHQFAFVANENGHERRILAHRIKNSNAKTGYTRVDCDWVLV